MKRNICRLLSMFLVGTLGARNVNAKPGVNQKNDRVKIANGPSTPKAKLDVKDPTKKIQKPRKRAHSADKVLNKDAVRQNIAARGVKKAHEAADILPAKWSNGKIAGVASGGTVGTAGVCVGGYFGIKALRNYLKKKQNLQQSFSGATKFGEIFPGIELPEVCLDGPQFQLTNDTTIQQLAVAIMVNNRHNKLGGAPQSDGLNYIRGGNFGGKDWIWKTPEKDTKYGWLFTIVGELLPALFSTFPVSFLSGKQDYDVARIFSDADDSVRNGFINGLSANNKTLWTNTEKLVFALLTLLEGYNGDFDAAVTEENWNKNHYGEHMTEEQLKAELGIA